MSAMVLVIPPNVTNVQATVLVSVPNTKQGRIVVTGDRIGTINKVYPSGKVTMSYGDLTITQKPGQTVWPLGAGGGPGPCDKSPFSDARATGVEVVATLAGTVTDDCGHAVSGATVSASGSGGGSKMTDATGRYAMTVSPGTYSVHVADSGIGVTPSRAQVSVGPSGTARADFVAHSCGDLIVQISVRNTVRSGLAVHDHPYNEFPVDFVSSVSPGVFSCDSGCADVVVTVTDAKTHKHVSGADVNASIDDSPGLAQGSNDSLCQTDDKGMHDAGCGTHVLGATTDDNGHAYFRYWAPGVTNGGTTTLSATARTTCTTSGCTVKQGSATPKVVNIKPYLIYEHTKALTQAEADELAEWAGGTSLFTKFLKTSNNGKLLFVSSLKWLKAIGIAAHKTAEALELVEKAEPILIPLELLEAINTLNERRAMISLFLENTDLDPTGLSANPSEATASSDPTLAFENHLADLGELVPVFDVAGGDWLYYAQVLRKVQQGNTIPLLIGGKTHNVNANLSHFSVGLQIYEVSSCDSSKGSCSPGYANDPGTSVVLHDGIQPRLHFFLTLIYNGHPFDQEDFEVPYDAIGWTEAMGDRLADVRRDFK